MRTAIVFPGQGSQHVGMCRDLHAAHAEVRDTLAEADEALGCALTRLMFEGPADELGLTVHCQPAMLAAGVAQYRVLRAAGVPEPDCLAGHSLGEYTALVCADALDFADALRLVRERGRLMQEAVPVGRGAMLAILGLAVGEVQALLADLGVADIVGIANHNGLAQVVISGLVEGIAPVQAELDRRHVFCVPLRVSAPFHSVHMRPAATGLSRALAGLDWRTPRIAVLANVTAQPHGDAGSLPALLADQLVSTVRWVDTMDALRDRGVTHLVECGPGNVLAKLLSSHEPSWTVLGTGTAPQCADAVAALVAQEASTPATRDTLLELVGTALHALATTPNLSTDLDLFETDVAAPYKRLRLAYLQLRRGKDDGTLPTPGEVRRLLDTALAAKALPDEVRAAQLARFDACPQPTP